MTVAGSNARSARAVCVSPIIFYTTGYRKQPHCRTRIIDPKQLLIRFDYSIRAMTSLTRRHLSENPMVFNRIKIADYDIVHKAREGAIGLTQQGQFAKHAQTERAIRKHMLISS